MRNNIEKKSASSTIRKLKKKFLIIELKIYEDKKKSFFSKVKRNVKLYIIFSKMRCEIKRNNY
jgi:hypothetical protein